MLNYGPAVTVTNVDDFSNFESVYSVPRDTPLRQYHDPSPFSSDTSNYLVCMLTHIHIFMATHIYSQYTLTHTCAHSYIPTHVHTHTYPHMRYHTYPHMCTLIHTHTCAHSYIPTHALSHIPQTHVHPQGPFTRVEWLL